MLIYVASAGEDVFHIIDLAEQSIIELLTSCSTRLCRCTSRGPTSLVLDTWHSTPPRYYMGLAERELECHRHLDDLLSSSADACAST